MRPALPLLVLLLAALIPLPLADAAGEWGVDARVTVKSKTSADYTWTFTGITNTNLELPVPDNATLVRAYDDDGRAIGANSFLRDGETWVKIEIRGRGATVLFSLVGVPDGPFGAFPAQVASATTSPVTLSVSLPTGWSLAGHRVAGGGGPSSDGVFRATGPTYIQLLVLEAGVVDPGPTAGSWGELVRREGVADVRLDGVTWTLTTTYDTDVYSRSWEVHVPDGATVVRATSPFGPLATSRDGDKLRVTTPYPVGYGLGARDFTVEMTLAAPTPHGGTFRELNLSVRAAEADDVRIRAKLADGLRYTGARVSEHAVETAPLEFRGRGPVSVGIGILPPPRADHVRFEQGLFVVDAPRVHEAAARATARNASETLPRVAGFAYEPADARPFFVAYTDADVFGWEEGFYSNGLNTISIRAKTLDAAADGAAHLVPVGILVHEATHGLIDRRLPHAPRDMSFLHEGLSRLAETRLETLFPHEIVQRDGSSYTRHSARPSADDLRAFHAQGKPFDAAWHASSVPDAERGALYDHSGLVFHAYDRRAPVGALANVLAFVNATSFPEDNVAASTALVRILRDNAPGATEAAILYPGREASHLPIEQFRHCLEGLVAPNYPWETTQPPPSGCPPTGYGPRDATLPTPPTPPRREPEFAEPAPATPTPRPPAPTTARPPTGSGTGGTPPDEGAPGAVVHEGDPKAPGTQTPSVIPGAGPALLLAALGALALAMRRRR